MAIQRKLQSTTQQQYSLQPRKVFSNIQLRNYGHTQLPTTYQAALSSSHNINSQIAIRVNRIKA